MKGMLTDIQERTVYDDLYFDTLPLLKLKFSTVNWTLNHVRDMTNFHSYHFPTLFS
jgi:hypothetical protein